MVYIFQENNAGLICDTSPWRFISLEDLSVVIHSEFVSLSVCRQLWLGARSDCYYNILHVPV